MWNLAAPGSSRIDSRYEVMAASSSPLARSALPRAVQVRVRHDGAVLKSRVALYHEADAAAVAFQKPDNLVVVSDFARLLRPSVIVDAHEVGQRRYSGFSPGTRSR